MARPKSTPRLCRHPNHDRGYVRVGDHFTYFEGEWPRSRKTAPPEIQRQYEDWLAAWSARRVDLPPPLAADPTLSVLWLAYYRHCRSYYVKHGKVTSEVASIVTAVRVVERLYGHEHARLFTPPKLKAVREEYIKLGWARGHVNKSVSRVRRMFRWAVSEGLVANEVLAALESVTDIGKGRRAGLREEVPVPPVDWETVEATLPHLPPTLADLVRFHWAVGCRAADAGAAHAGDIDREAAPDLWLWRPRTHKTEHLDGPPLEYWLGPRAQELLAPLLDQRSGWLFPTGRTTGSGHWTTGAYRQAVARAVARADADRGHPPRPVIPHWYPLQVRHSRAQAIRDAHPKGIEAVQAALGHAQVETSQIYADRTTTLPQDVARLLG